MDPRAPLFGWLLAASISLLPRPAPGCPLAGQREALAEVEAKAKNWAEAQKDYALVTEACPDDPAAWRNLGRIAGANGDLTAAEAALARANQLANGAPDPELHFLRGELLFELGRTDEATREHDQAIREIGPAPTDRNLRLWLARIEARRGHLDAADALFAAIEVAALPAGDDEAALTRAEVLIRGHKLARAHDVLQQVRQRAPANTRALELLAWLYESQQRLDAELAVRAELAGAKPQDARVQADYGRALERADRKVDALAAYSRARSIQYDRDAEESYQRLAHQLSPEVIVALSGFAEPAANAIRLATGGSAQVAADLRLGATGWVDAGARTTLEREKAATVGVIAFADASFADHLDVRGALSYRHGRLPRRDIDQIVSLGRDTIGAEVSAVATVGAGLLAVRAAYHTEWTDAALAVVEGGDQTGAELHIGYPLLHDRLVLDGGLLARRLELSADVDGSVPSATHVGWTAGADAVVWRNNAQRLRGEILDERLQRPVYLQDAVVLGYRHYDASVRVEPSFFQRVALADRASLDALTAAVRKVMFDKHFGIELRGLAGYDRGRESTVLGVGLSAYVVSWRGGRLVLLTEVATESAAVVLGRRTWSSLSFHHDLM